MRTDLLSQRLFTAGCFALPWLWVVHVLYWNGSKEENEGLINPDDHFHDAPTEQTQDEIRAKAEIWVQRAKRSAIIFFTLWLAWIVTAQVLKDVFPPSLYMLRNDDEALTGW